MPSEVMGTWRLMTSANPTDPTPRPKRSPFMLRACPSRKMSRKADAKQNRAR